MSLFMKQKQTHRQKTNLLLQKGEEINQEFGINIYTLLFVKQINNKVLLYSTGNYIEYPIIICNGNEYDKEDIQMKTALHQIPKQHGTSSILQLKKIINV